VGASHRTLKTTQSASRGAALQDALKHTILLRRGPEGVAHWRSLTLLALRPGRTRALPADNECQMVGFSRHYTVCSPRDCHLGTQHPSSDQDTWFGTRCRCADVLHFFSVLLSSRYQPTVLRVLERTVHQFQSTAQIGAAHILLSTSAKLFVAKAWSKYYHDAYKMPGLVSTPGVVRPGRLRQWAQHQHATGEGIIRCTGPGTLIAGAQKGAVSLASRI
jgi:hypothetical protein